MFIFGLIFWLKQIPVNGIFGVRTFEIMKSQAVWDYSHRIWGKITSITNFIILILLILIIILLFIYREYLREELVSPLLMGVPTAVSFLSLIVCSMYIHKKAKAFNVANRISRFKNI